MMISRKAISALLIGLSLTLVSGCWSSVELNRRAFVRLMLLDQTENGVELTLGFPLPNRMTSGKAGGGGDSGGSKTEPFTYITKSGSTIGEAYQKIQADLPRRITFGQLRNIVMGREFATIGILPMVDFLAREPNIHINGSIFVTEGKAKAVAEIPVIFERFPTDILWAFVKLRMVLPVSVKDVLMSTYTGGDFLAPMLTFSNQGAEFEEKGDHWMSTNGAAIFKHGRMVGTLDTQQTRGALWIMGKLNNAEIDAASPTDGKPVSVVVRNARSTIYPEIRANRITFRIRCTGEATLIGSESGINLAEPKQLAALKRAVDHRLETRITNAINETKKAQADVFALGSHLQWRYPRRWERVRADWPLIYEASVNVYPQADIAIKWIGVAKTPDWNRRLSGGDS